MVCTGRPSSARRFSSACSLSDSSDEGSGSGGMEPCLLATDAAVYEREMPANRGRLKNASTRAVRSANSLASASTVGGSSARAMTSSWCPRACTRVATRRELQRAPDRNMTVNSKDGTPGNTPITWLDTTTTESYSSPGLCYR